MVSARRTYTQVEEDQNVDWSCTLTRTSDPTARPDSSLSPLLQLSRPSANHSATRLFGFVDCAVVCAPFLGGRVAVSRARGHSGYVAVLKSLWCRGRATCTPEQYLLNCRVLRWDVHDGPTERY